MTDRRADMLALIHDTTAYSVRVARHAHEARQLDSRTRVAALRQLVDQGRALQARYGQVELLGIVDDPDEAAVVAHSDGMAALRELLRILADVEELIRARTRPEPPAGYGQPPAEDVYPEPDGA